MANERFAAMKSRSEELNRKMEEIRWCVSTMRGILRQACRQFDSCACMVKEDLGREPRRESTFFVSVGIDKPMIPYLRISRGWITGQIEEMNPDLDWWHPEIDLIHANLDTIIGACEKFCKELGAEIGFVVQMDRFEDLFEMK